MVFYSFSMILLFFAIYKKSGQIQKFAKKNNDKNVLYLMIRKYRIH